MNRKNHLTIVVSILMIITLLLWLSAPAGLPRFASFFAILTSLGQIFGLMGVVLFSINLILSARLRFFDNLFNGLNNVYIKHNQLGQITLIMLLFHPLLLIFKYATNISEAASFLWLSRNWAINWGIFALGLIIILLVITLYLRPKYNIWKITHKFLGFSFFLASLHVWFIPSDTSRFLPLKIYIVGFLVLGLVAFVYKSVLGRFLIKKYKYVVTEIKKANALITEIVLAPQDQKLQFRSGQFVFVEFINSNIGSESHPFSMVSSPAEKQISFMIKNLGDYTADIKNLTRGTTALLEGPFGNFNFQNSKNKSQIWVAGGIGITPFISMAKNLLETEGYDIDLFYCVNNQKEAVGLDLLENIALKLGRSFRITLICSQTDGRFSIETLKRICPQYTQKDFFICAPPIMISELRKNLRISGVNNKSINSEEFDL